MCYASVTPTHNRIFTVSLFRLFDDAISLSTPVCLYCFLFERSVQTTAICNNPKNTGTRQMRPDANAQRKHPKRMHLFNHIVCALDDEGAGQLKRCTMAVNL